MRIIACVLHQNFYKHTQVFRKARTEQELLKLLLLVSSDGKKRRNSTELMGRRTVTPQKETALWMEYCWRKNTFTHSSLNDTEVKKETHKIEKNTIWHSFLTWKGDLTPSIPCWKKLSDCPAFIGGFLRKTLLDHIFIFALSIALLSRLPIRNPGRKVPRLQGLGCHGHQLL